jgi:putative membrane protein
MAWSNAPPRARGLSFPFAVVWLTCSLGAQAHDLAAHDGMAAALGWNRDWWLWVLIAGSGWMYAMGLRRLWRAAGGGSGITRGQAAAFALGWLTLAVALLSPLDTLSAHLFSAHMVQHELLMIVAAPLLVLGHPLGPFVWSLPARWRQPAFALCRESGLQACVRWLTRPLPAWLVAAAALWLWHVPVCFDAALENEALHALQHTTFLVTSLLFWWSLFARRAPAHRLGLGAFSVFTAGMQSSLLGALLTFSASAWYAPYAGAAGAWELSPVQDQQLGGLIMWVPGGLVYLGVALVLMAKWLMPSDESAATRDSRLTQH